MITAAWHSLLTWYEIPTCLFLSGESGSQVFLRDPSLSPRRIVGPFILVTPRDLRRYLRDMASSDAVLPACNSVDDATCLREDPFIMALPTYTTIIPVIDRLVTTP